MSRIALILSGVALVAACGPSEVNAPTQPARPVDTPLANAPAAAPPPGTAPLAPGAGPQNFIGRWAANVSWCSNTQGAERPIEITATRLEGYENSCAIDSIDQQADGYIASLSCAAEGMTNRERVRLSASGQTLRMTYLDRDGATVNLTKCTTLGDTPQTGPSLKLN